MWIILTVDVSPKPVNKKWYSRENYVYSPYISIQYMYRVSQKKILSFENVDKRKLTCYWL